MKAEVESITPVKSKITVEVPAEEYQQAEKAAVNQLRRSVSIPGFRKGKAPAQAILRLYGDRIRSEAIGNLIQKTYGEALKEHELWPVDDPDVEIEKAEDDGALVYTAVIETRPKVEPKGYKDLKLKREQLVVDPTATEARLQSIREQGSTFDPAADDYEAANGDLVVIDFEGTIDGEPFEGGKAEGHSLFLGSGRMIPGFEEGILGAKNGEERTIDVTFPEDYPAEDLAGKKAQFAINVNEVKKKTLPELDDDFAKNVAQMETFDELKAKIEEVVKQEQEGRIEGEFKQKLIDLLLAANPFEVPDSLVTRQQEHSIERMRADFSQRGMDHLSERLDDPAFIDEARKSAERSVRWAFLLDAIAEAEGVEVTEKDLEDRIREIAEADGRSYTAIKAFFEKEDHLDSLRNSLREKKAVDAILSTADIEEVDAQAWADYRGEG